MPELPEVETIKNELLPEVTGRKFTQVIIFDPKIIRGTTAYEFCQKLVGQKIEKLGRRGKYLIFELQASKTLIIHLKMAGALLLNFQKPNHYIRALFHLDNGTSFAFYDKRRFGVMWLVEDKETIVGKLGPEPLADEFTTEILASRLKGRRAPIKAVLLDQNFIAGIGNMYADEALFKAKIHPLRKADSLSPAEVQNLYQSIRETLWLAIDNKGASVDAYVRPWGDLGTAHFNFQVAHRNTKPCPICGTPIKRLPLRNRGTYFCPNCQKL